RRLKELEVKRRKSRKDERPHRVGSGSDASALTGSASEGLRESWWTERGSQRFINDSESLETAILYVRDAQDKSREHEADASAPARRSADATSPTASGNPRERFGLVSPRRTAKDRQGRWSARSDNATRALCQR